MVMVKICSFGFHEKKFIFLVCTNSCADCVVCSHEVKDTIFIKRKISSLVHVYVDLLLFLFDILLCLGK